MEVDELEYIDCIQAREDLIKIASDLYNAENQQAKKTKLKAKQKPTITHWHARGAHSMSKWLLKKYPILEKLGKNPELYKGNTTKIYSK